MAVSQFTDDGTGVNISGVVISAGTVDLDGVGDALILDSDGDTTISAPTDDQIDIEIAGADDFTFTSGKFNVLSNSEITGASSNSGLFTPIAAQQDLSGAGAINVTSYYTAWTTTGTDAGTLADGNAIGQLKKVTLVSDGGDGTLTPTNLSGGTDITFADVGDTALLGWDGSNWIALELTNLADGSSAPVLA